MATEIYAPQAFQVIYYGVETTPGTAVSSTAIAQGSRLTTYPMADHVYETFEDESSGILVPHVTAPLKVKTTSNFVWEGALNNVDGIVALDMAITNGTTEFQPDWTTQGNAPRASNGSYAGIATYTFEFGDVVSGYYVDYCFARRLQIQGTHNELVKFTCDITGQATAEKTLKTGLSRSTVFYFPYEKASFYIDSTYASLGSSQKSGVLKGFTWTLDTAFAPMFAADGTTTFSKVVEGKKRVVLEMQIARDNTIGEAMYNAYQNQTIQYIQIKLLSTSLPNFKLDGAYRYLDWGLAEEDGLMYANVTAESVWDSTASNSFEVNYSAT